MFKAKESKFELEVPRSQFTIKSTNELVKYLAVLNAIYIDFMDNDRIDKWANELEILRPHVILAGRKLAKVRYRDLEKTD